LEAIGVTAGQNLDRQHRDGSVGAPSDRHPDPAQPHVDASAVGVAACRALESSRPAPLYVDPFAAALVEALPEPSATRALNGDDPRFIMMSTYLAARNQLFDRFLTEDGSKAGMQWVLLGAGLDTRAYRLPLTRDASVFELDRGATLRFKTSVLSALGVVPAGRHELVDVDLREDWPAALLASGFDRGRPAAWVAEGLLAQLPGKAQDLLFARIDDLSAPGSRLVADSPGTSPAALRDSPDMQSLMEQHNVPESSVSDEDRADPVEWLRERGWSVRAEQAGAVVRRAGRTLDTALGDIMATFSLVTAEKL
jgi:methyltransferase (TIGR00027 family)